MNKETNSGALDIVTRHIDLAIDSVGTVLGLIEDCGLDEAAQDVVKDGMLSCLLALNLAYDVVALADDEGEQP